MNRQKSQPSLNREQVRATKLAEMGAQLRQLREQQQIPLEQIAAKTMIRKSLLQAIEEGRIEKLPEPVYIHGFLLRFAEALGLDGVAFAKQFPVGSKWRSLQFSWWRYLPLPQIRPIHLYLFYIVLIVCSVKVLSGVMNTTAMRSQNPTTVQVNESDPGNGKTPAQPASATADASVSSPGNPNKSVRVGLTFQDASWVQIIADGKTEFEGTLPEGTQRTWEANQQLVVRAGNAGGVLFAVNDGQAKRMGAPGAVEEVVVPAEE